MQDAVHKLQTTSLQFSCKHSFKPRVYSEFSGQMALYFPFSSSFLGAKTRLRRVHYRAKIAHRQPPSNEKLESSLNNSNRDNKKAPASPTANAAELEQYPPKTHNKGGNTRTQQPSKCGRAQQKTPTLSARGLRLGD